MSIHGGHSRDQRERPDIRDGAFIKEGSYFFFLKINEKKRQKKRRILFLPVQSSVPSSAKTGLTNGLRPLTIIGPVVGTARVLALDHPGRRSGAAVGCRHPITRHMTQCGARALSRSANEALSKSTRRRSNHGSPVEEVKNQNPNGWSLAWAALSSVLTTQSANVVTPRAAARALPAVSNNSRTNATTGRTREAASRPVVAGDTTASLTPSAMAGRSPPRGRWAPKIARTRFLT